MLFAVAHNRCFCSQNYDLTYCVNGDIYFINYIVLYLVPSLKPHFESQCSSHCSLLGDIFYCGSTPTLHLYGGELNSTLVPSGSLL